jgi:toxin HigB-1
MSIWIILEHRNVEKKIKKIPREVLARYLVWKEIIEAEGPDGLLRIPGFRDEILKGIWKGYRSSRLGLKWRVIYQIEKGVLRVLVIELNAHKY